MLNWQTTMDTPLNSLAALAVQLQMLVATVVNHPVQVIVIVVLGIVLLQIIADVIKRLIKASLAFALKLPLTLSQWIWQQLTSPPVEQPKTLDQLIDRLDTLRQEQDQVVTEMKALLLESKSHSAEALKSAQSSAISLKKSPKKPLEKSSDTAKSAATQASAKK